MTAAVHDIVIEQGATFVFNLVWRDRDNLPVDLSGYSARMHIRTKHTAPTTLLHLSVDEGTILLGGTLGTIECRVEADVTAALPIKTGVYDLELQDVSGFVTRLVEGEVTITPEVTR